MHQQQSKLNKCLKVAATVIMLKLIDKQRVRTGKVSGWEALTDFSGLAALLAMAAERLN